MELEQVCNGSLFEISCSPCPMRTSPPPDFPCLSRRFPRRNRMVVNPILRKYFAELCSSKLSSLLPPPISRNSLPLTNRPARSVTHADTPPPLAQLAPSQPLQPQPHPAPMAPLQHKHHLPRRLVPCKRARLVGWEGVDVDDESGPGGGGWGRDVRRGWWRGPGGFRGRGKYSDVGGGWGLDFEGGG